MSDEAFGLRACWPHFVWPGALAAFLSETRYRRLGDGTPDRTVFPRLSTKDRTTFCFYNNYYSWNILCGFFHNKNKCKRSNWVHRNNIPLIHYSLIITLRGQSILSVSRWDHCLVGAALLHVGWFCCGRALPDFFMSDFVTILFFIICLYSNLVT